jgi:hypothetical protein
VRNQNQVQYAPTQGVVDAVGWVCRGGTQEQWGAGEVYKAGHRSSQVQPAQTPIQRPPLHWCCMQLCADRSHMSGTWSLPFSTLLAQAPNRQAALKPHPHEHPYQPSPAPPLLPYHAVLTWGPVLKGGG